MKRRKFLENVGGVAGMIAVTPLLIENLHLQDLLSDKPLTELPWPVLKKYDQEHTSKIALPVGGIGTGTVSLGEGVIFRIGK